MNPHQIGAQGNTRVNGKEESWWKCKLCNQVCLGDDPYFNLECHVAAEERQRVKTRLERDKSLLKE